MLYSRISVQKLLIFVSRWSLQSSLLQAFLAPFIVHSVFYWRSQHCCDLLYALFCWLSFGPAPPTEQNLFQFPLAFCYCLKHQIYLSLPSHDFCLLSHYTLCHYQEGFAFIIPPVSSHTDAGCSWTIPVSPLAGQTSSAPQPSP